MSASATDQTAGKTQTTGHSMRLPRELRNKIYTSVWRLRPVFNVNSERIFLQLRFEDADALTSAPEGLPTWLRTCKTFLDEGLEELQLKATWETGPYHTPFANTYWTHHVNRADTKLLDPATATELTVRIVELDADYCGNHKELLWWYIPTLDRNTITAELKHKELVAGLRTLQFAFMLQGLEHFYGTIPKNQHTECNFGVLDDCLPGIAKFELEVCFPDCATAPVSMHR